MEKQKDNIYSELESEIQNLSLEDKQKTDILRKIQVLKGQHINILITGATGCGKSSTINALFNTLVARIGVGVDPETMSISEYQLDHLTLWDSPGLGDGKEKDRQHAENIIDKLMERDENGEMLIDLVLVILDGSSRDLGTSYELINQVIIPNLQDKKRILIAINQADAAMKGRGWNAQEHRPEPELAAFLDEKVRSVRERIKEGTGVDVDPIYYSAGYTDPVSERQETPYNLSKLLYFILQHTPTRKRLAYIQNINKNKQMWKSDDGLKRYGEKIKKSFIDTIDDCVDAGRDIGESIGRSIGAELLGRVVGVVGGVIGGVAKAVCNWLF